MPDFLLLYTGGDSPQSEAEGAAVMKAWTDWFTTLGPAVVDPGNPFQAAAKTIAPGGRVTDGAQGAPATGYSIIKADSLDAATQVARGCPHLDAQGTVTVYEAFPVM